MLSWTMCTFHFVVDLCHLIWICNHFYKLSPDVHSYIFYCVRFYQSFPVMRHLKSFKIFVVTHDTSSWNLFFSHRITSQLWYFLFIRQSEFELINVQSLGVISRNRIYTPRQQGLYLIFFSIIVLQYVGHPPGRYEIWFYHDCAPPTISLKLLLCLWT